MKIITVIVTFNRLALLQEAIKAVLSQTLKTDELLIINNNSTDGTAEYLESIEDDTVHTINLPENIGGAGGFHEGIKHAINRKADWVWLMDDDTIPTPTALEMLVQHANDNIGFLSSKALWTDGSLHIMNKQWTAAGKVITEDTPSLSKLRSASFVSLFVNAKSIRNVGLPYKEFFIWCDDSEYTTRISNAKYDCLLVNESVVVHKTNTNYMSSLVDAPANTAWKFYYNIRNMVFIKRMQYKNPIVFYLKILNFYRLQLHQIGKRKDTNKDMFKKEIKRGFKDGLSFTPKIEYV